MNKRSSCENMHNVKKCHPEQHVGQERYWREHVEEEEAEPVVWGGGVRARVRLGGKLMYIGVSRDGISYTGRPHQFWKYSLGCEAPFANMAKTHYSGRP